MHIGGLIILIYLMIMHGNITFFFSGFWYARVICDLLKSVRFRPKKNLNL